MLGNRSAARGRVVRVLGTAAAVTAVGLAIVSAGSAARAPTPLPDGALENITPVVTPLGLSNAPTTIMLEVAGDPVTVVDAATPLTKDQKKAVKDRLKGQQKGIEQQVRAAGGTVLGDYQSAYNGIKVSIASNKAKGLAAIPGVVAVHPLQAEYPANVHGVPLIGAPTAWDGVNGLHGEGLKIAIIDTGIDYTHADFGGSGNPADYITAHAAETLPANPLWFGPSAPRVKGGIDLVGDAYTASAPAGSPALVPQPDPNPLDCNGHGSHTAGTAAGSGVLASGTTYGGPYDATTVSSHSWNVGPGVAPKADIYAIRVFGCSGSTNETVDAIEWAVDHDMDVINMSLGSPFGGPDNPSAVASTNAAKDGVIVVGSAGNEGSNPYMTGGPSAGVGSVSVAASDPTQAFPGANMALSTDGTIQAIDANGFPFADGTTLPVKVLFSSPGVISLGCDPADYVGVAGTIVVTARGSCARVARAIFGQQAGAAAVIMVNTSSAFPPYEGQITSNPDTGIPYTVTIPFFGVPGGSNPSTSANGQKLIAADGGTITLTNTTLTNPGYLGLASFTSGGPRTGDSALKPEVTAPGVSIASVGIGTGTGAAIMSGTSMAAPHTAGAAVLVRQAHPDWKKVAYWKAALVNTAIPSLVTGYQERLAGAGFLQVQNAVSTQAIATADKDQPELNFGFEDLDKDFAKKAHIKVRNLGGSPATFDVSEALSAGRPHSLSIKQTSITVPAHGDKDVEVELDVPAATAGVGAIPGATSFADVRGQIVFTPAGGDNNGVTLRVPYYLVPQATSKIDTKLDVGKLKKNLTEVATTTNKKDAAGSGDADWYAWGLTDKKDHGLGSNDLTAVGAQASIGTSPTNSFLAFAVQTQHRWSNAAMNEFDVYVDVNGDGAADYDVLSFDVGRLTAGSYDGRTGVFVFPIDASGSFGTGSLLFLADAPTDTNTMTLPVRLDQLCRATYPCLDGTTNTRITYTAVGFGLTDDTTDTIDATATFNPFSPAISNGMFDTLNPGDAANETVSINAAEWPQSTPEGLMIVSHNNRSGKDEAQLVKVDLKLK
jgi:minor extracellular serine protease Vpr